MPEGEKRLEIGLNSDRYGGGRVQDGRSVVVRCDAKSRGIYAREIAGYRRFSDRNVIESDAVSRRRLLKVTWNTIEGIVAVLAGAVAGSISLVGFGIDSFIEVISGAALLWLMIVDADAHRRECNERRALRIVGFCFVALAAYVAYESANDLWQRQAAERSVPGIILACLSLVVMPLLSRAKRRVGLALGSAAMHADAKQAEFCTYLSAILLGGLVVSALFGLWWADPLAALIMVPIIAKEGIEAIQGKSCADCH